MCTHKRHQTAKRSQAPDAAATFRDRLGRFCRIEKLFKFFKSLRGKEAANGERSG
jgi:hypothetical protein